MIMELDRTDVREVTQDMVCAGVGVVNRRACDTEML